MRISNRVFVLLAAVLFTAPVTAYSQSSSLNAYSPYTFYGIGDMFTQGTAPMRAMGGAGVAVRDYTSMNYLNPAAYSAIPRQSVLFSVGLQGQNFYLSDANAKSSFNTFNIRDLGFQMPLANGFGLSFSVTPYSNVGYRVYNAEDEGVEVTDVGYVSRSFSGSGGINQFKLGVGWELWKGKVSIGAEMVYLHGNIVRTYDVILNPIVASGTFVNLYGTNTEQINTLLMNAGIQANLISSQQRVVSLGLVYKMGGRLRGNVTDYILHDPSEGIPSAEALGLVDLARSHAYSSRLYMPHEVIAGVYYARPSYAVAVDYTFSSWGSSNSGNNDENVSFRNTHTIAGGIEWTPNAIDARNYFNRCTYRIGARYGNYYMSFLKDGELRGFDDAAVTLGIGFPLDPRRRNSIDVGLEAGTRGTVRYGLIKEQYLKFSIGFRFFGDDYWFQKYKYN